MGRPVTDLQCRDNDKDRLELDGRPRKMGKCPDPGGKKEPSPPGPPAWPLPVQCDGFRVSRGGGGGVRYVLQV